MAYQALVLKVIIASPADVEVERRIAREVLHSWNSIHSKTERLVLLPIGWETHSSPELSGRPQSLINERVLSDCDLLVGIFWNRVGSETGAYRSGTIEEIEEHRKAGKPVMLYFSERPAVMSSVDQKQVSDLLQFKSQCLPLGIVETFSTDQEFQSKLDRHMRIALDVSPYLKNLRSGTSTAEPVRNSSRELAIQPALNSGKLNTEAKTLLVSAAQGDGLILHRTYIGGEMISVRDRNFADERTSPRDLAQWKEGIAQLLRGGLVEMQSTSIYRVTASGYRMFDILKEQPNSDVLI